MKNRIRERANELGRKTGQMLKHLLPVTNMDASTTSLPTWASTLHVLGLPLTG
jgi:hypothetical protein